jgi:hypothetical protein
MLASDRAATRPRAGRLVAVAVLVALVILAGHTQQAYYTFILATIAACIRLGEMAVRRHQLRRAAKSVLLLAGGVGLGIGLTALQLAATYDLIRQSNRNGGLSVAQASSVSLPARGVLGNLLPDYTADHPAELAGSIGAAALLLISLALVARWRRPQVALWALLGVVAVLTAFGPRAHLYDLFYQVLPGMRLFRAPARLLVFATVAGAVLAGHGVLTAHQLAIAWRRRRWRARIARTLAAAGVLASLPGLALLAVFLAQDPQRGVLRVFPAEIAPENVALLIGFPIAALVLIAVGLQLGRRPRSVVLGALLPALVLADLALLEGHTYPLDPVPDSLYHTRPAAATLVAPGLDHRYLSIVPYYNNLPAAGRIPAGLDVPEDATYLAYLRMIDSMVPNNGMVNGPLNADGYDGGLLPTQAYVDFRVPLLPSDTTNPPDFTDRLLTDRVWHPEWLREAGVDAVITAQGQDPNPPGCPHCLLPGGSAGGMEVWHLTGPRVTRAHLESGLPARIVEDTGERVIVDLPTGASGRLVLADSYYPGWIAEVDGHPTSIERYDGYIRAVHIPTGARVVVFTYQPRWLTPALGVSLACLLALALLSLWALAGGRLRAAGGRPRSLP